jgi:hypothetical protein
MSLKDKYVETKMRLQDRLLQNVPAEATSTYERKDRPVVDDALATDAPPAPGEPPTDVETVT